MLSSHSIMGILLGMATGLSPLVVASSEDGLSVSTQSQESCAHLAARLLGPVPQLVDADDKPIVVPEGDWADFLSRRISLGDGTSITYREFDRLGPDFWAQHPKDWERVAKTLSQDLTKELTRRKIPYRAVVSGPENILPRYSIEIGPQDSPLGKLPAPRFSPEHQMGVARERSLQPESLPPAKSHSALPLSWLGLTEEHLPAYLQSRRRADILIDDATIARAFLNPETPDSDFVLRWGERQSRRGQRFFRGPEFDGSLREWKLRERVERALAAVTKHSKPITHLEVARALSDYLFKTGVPVIYERAPDGQSYDIRVLSGSEKQWKKRMKPYELKGSSPARPELSRLAEAAREFSTSVVFNTQSILDAGHGMDSPTGRWVLSPKSIFSQLPQEMVFKDAGAGLAEAQQVLRRLQELRSLRLFMEPREYRKLGEEERLEFNRILTTLDPKLAEVPELRSTADALVAEFASVNRVSHRQINRSLADGRRQEETQLRKFERATVEDYFAPQFSEPNAWNGISLKQRMEKMDQVRQRVVGSRRDLKKLLALSKPFLNQPEPTDVGIELFQIFQAAGKSFPKLLVPWVQDLATTTQSDTIRMRSYRLLAELGAADTKTRSILLQGIQMQRGSATPAAISAFVKLFPGKNTSTQIEPLLVDPHYMSRNVALAALYEARHFTSRALLYALRGIDLTAMEVSPLKYLAASKTQDPVVLAAIKKEAVLRMQEKNPKAADLLMVLDKLGVRDPDLTVPVRKYLYQQRNLNNSAHLFLHHLNPQDPEGLGYVMRKLQEGHLSPKDTLAYLDSYTRVNAKDRYLAGVVRDLEEKLLQDPIPDFDSEKFADVKERVRRQSPLRIYRPEATSQGKTDYESPR